MDDTEPSRALEECRALCRQLLPGSSLRRAPSESDTVCVSSSDALPSFSMGAAQLAFVLRCTMHMELTRIFQLEKAEFL
jgi:hypothetical protein